MITFILPAFGEKYYPAIQSLLCQTNPNWKAIVYHNGFNAVMRDQVINLDPRITYRESDTNTGMWGTLNRILALEEVTTDYVIQSSIQDYWVPWAVQTILSSNASLIYFNSINHLIGPQVLDCELQGGRVDWGNVAVRTPIAKAAGIPQPEAFAADWHTFEKILADNPYMTIEKISQVLTIHN